MNQSVFYFPIFAIIASIIAYYFPSTLVLYKPMIIPLLGLVMFGMGITLTPRNFLAVLSKMKVIGLGLILQFGLMPLLAYLLGNVLGLPLLLLTGMVLVGACPGGTASNVICYLAKGDVALSICLTACSTVLAVILTPFLVWLYIGQQIDVPVLNMLINIFKIILIPVSLGVLVNYYFGDKLQLIKSYFPLVSMAAIVLIISIIVALNQQQIAALVFSVLFAVCLHNLAGLLAGYYLAKIAGYSPKICKTLAIEVGMQNSGLAVALAIKYFPVAAALPGAIFSVWHNISGAVLASYFANQDSLSSKMSKS